MQGHLQTWFTCYRSVDPHACIRGTQLDAKRARKLYFHLLGTQGSPKRRSRAVLRCWCCTSSHTQLPGQCLHNSVQFAAMWGASLAPHQQELQLCWRCRKPVGWAEARPPLFGPQAQPRRWRRRAACQLQVTAVCLPVQQGGVPASNVGSGDGQQKRWDVVALGNSYTRCSCGWEVPVAASFPKAPLTHAPGNLCVDVVVPLDQVRWVYLLLCREFSEALSEDEVLARPAAKLRAQSSTWALLVTTRGWLYMQMPPPAEVKSESLLRSLMQRPPARESWEVGGNCNFMIAAARLGLQVAALGNLGGDVYGRFLRDVVKVLLLLLRDRPFLLSGKAFCAANRACRLYVFRAQQFHLPMHRHMNHHHSYEVASGDVKAMHILS